MAREAAPVIQSVASLMLLSFSVWPASAAATAGAENATPPTAVPAAPVPATAAAPTAAPAPATGPVAVKPATSAATPSETVPQFEPGMWEYRRTVTSGLKHDSEVVKRCSSPTSDIRQKLASLPGQGCRLSPSLHQDNHYEFRWVCPAAKGVVVVHDRLTVISTTSYQDDDEVLHAPQATRTTIVATRLGECPPTSSVQGPHR